MIERRGREGRRVNPNAVGKQQFLQMLLPPSQEPFFSGFRVLLSTPISIFPPQGGRRVRNVTTLCPTSVLPPQGGGRLMNGSIIWPGMTNNFPLRFQPSSESSVVQLSLLRGHFFTVHGSLFTVHQTWSCRTTFPYSQATPH